MAPEPETASPSTRLERLDAAVAAFEGDDPSGCLAILGALPDGGGDLGRALGLASEGLLADAAGERARARERMQLADGLGVPLPALLRTLGRWFHRTGDYDRAFRCHALLAPLDPGAWGRFRRGLPPAVAARYLPVLTAALTTEPTRPPHHDVGDAEDGLVDRLGADATAILLARSQLQPHVPRRVRRVDLHAELRDRGGSVEVLAPGRSLVLRGAPVHGEAAGAGTPARSRPIVRGVLRDVLVLSKSYVLLREDRGILDARPEELARLPVQLSADAAIVAVDGDELVCIADPSSSGHLPTAISLVGSQSTAFGHWMLEFLPRLFALMDVPGFASVPVLVDAQMPAQHHQSLRVLLGPDHPVVVVEPGRSVRVDRLLAATGALYLPLAPAPGVTGPPDLLCPDAPTLARLIRAGLPPDPAGAPTGARIYLSRGDRARRRLEDAPAVEAWFRSGGWEVVDPAELGFAEQLALVRRADWVVAPDGSAFYLTWFARPGTRLGLLTNSDHTDIGHIVEMADALGQPLLVLPGQVTRPHPHFREMSDYTIDPARLPGFLDALGALG